MPAQKRSHDALQDDPLLRNHSERHEDAEESDRSPSSSCGEKDEFITVKLSDIRKEVQCPICLGIIRKTRTVMECLHRFCRECIDKSMRMGNNECPACRTHCASRRSLRDDPNYDSLIAALYPDIDKYEEEELAFHEEEKARNKQIQASIAQTFRRQSEALGRKRPPKTSSPASMRRSQSSSRRRRNYRATEIQISDEDEDMDGNDRGKDSSSADERCTEVKPKRLKRWGGPRFSQPSSAAGSADGGDENDSELNRESMGVSVGLVGNSERLAWGKGGMRSHTRYGSAGGGNGKNARNIRLSKLIDRLRSLEENADELDIHLMLVSVDAQRLPSLLRPYLCCKPSLSVRHLCQYVALQTQYPTNEVEILMVKEMGPKFNSFSSTGVPISDFNSIGDISQKEMQILEEQETLGRLQSIFNSSGGCLLLAYRSKFAS